MGILSARKGASTVKDYVEWLYALLHTGSQGHFESANYRKVPYPYEATFDTTNTGVRVDSAIFCGHNPYLVACKATNVELIDPEGDEPSLRWVTPSRLICDPESLRVADKIPGVVRQAPIHLPIQDHTIDREG